MSHNLSLQESPEVKARLVNYLKGDDSFATPRKIDVLYTDSPASGALTESILESVLLRKGLSSRSFHIENQMLKPCLASEMLVTRLNFKRVGDSISCEIDGQDFQRSSGSAELSQLLVALGRSARTAGDSMLIISGLEHCVADIGHGYATLKFAASEDRGFQRVFAEVSPESAQKLGLGVLTRSNAYNLSSVDIGADPALAADIRASLAQRRASAPSAAAPSTASPPPGA